MKIYYTKAILLTSILLSTTSSALTLEEATYIAIENNPSVRQSIAIYHENKAAVDLAKSGYKPSLDLSAGLGHETTYNTDTDDVSLTRRELSISFTQPLFRGFQTQNEIKRSINEAEASRWTALTTIENIALDVADVFSNVLRFKELLKLSELNLKAHERIYQQLKLKSEAGVGRQSDLTLINARLSKAHSNRLAAINNLVDAKSQYLRVVGELPPEDLILPVPDRDLLPTSLEMALEQALENNPAIAVANFDAQATEHAKLSAQSAFYPQIDFDVERTWNNNFDGTKGPAEDLLAVVRLRYNLYRGGSDKQRLSITEQQIIQAQEVRRDTIRGTELTVRLAWAAHKATAAQKKYMQQHVIATKESQMAYENQFRLGRRTLLDVLDSENELFQARQDYVNTDYDELFSEFRLFNSKGQLMRALRVYSPLVLGFNDTPEDESNIATPRQDAIESLKQAESALLSDEPINTSGSQTSPLTESDLFLDYEDGRGW
ncbi:TolC family outer membrane protein [Marinomonas sp. 2405UD68-3]|uniref:TolC family outer membrane protein n=1 Tax=Marinomonas sp. 2405UD68-3 TaxID=3391835 RepID=UPI0039C9E077